MVATKSYDNRHHRCRWNCWPPGSAETVRARLRVSEWLGDRASLRAQGRQARGGIVPAGWCGIARRPGAGRDVPCSAETRCRVRVRTGVQHVAMEPDSVLVQTSAGDIRARAVVVTAGAWVTRFLATLGLERAVSAARETVAHFQPRNARVSPPLSEWRPEEKRVTYGLVARDGLLKVGVSGSGTPADPRRGSWSRSRSRP